MKIFKFFIPSGETKPIDEVETFTVKWSVYTGWSRDIKTMHKVFIRNVDADEFEKSLKDAAKLIDAYITTSKYRN